MPVQNWSWRASVGQDECIPTCRGSPALAKRQFVPACPRFFSGTVSCQLLSHPISCLRSGWKLTRCTVYNSRNLVFNLWSLLDRFSRFGAFFSVPPVCWAHLKLCAASKLSQQCFVEKVRLDILHMFLWLTNFAGIGMFYCLGVSWKRRASTADESAPFLHLLYWQDPRFATSTYNSKIILESSVDTFVLLLSML